MVAPEGLLIEVWLKRETNPGLVGEGGIAGVTEEGKRPDGYVKIGRVGELGVLGEILGELERAGTEDKEDAL